MSLNIQELPESIELKADLKKLAFWLERRTIRMEEELKSSNDHLSTEQHRLDYLRMKTYLTKVNSYMDSGIYYITPKEFDDSIRGDKEIRMSK